MKTMTITCMLTFLLVTQSNAQTINDLKGTWHNELKSKLEIVDVNSSTGVITGTYTLSSSQKFTLTGWVNDLPAANGKDHVIAVAFSVRFNSYGSITSWTGYLTKNSNLTENNNSTLNIHTIWNLVRPNSDQTWDHIVTNCDLFTK